MKFERIRHDGVKESVRRSRSRKGDQIVPYSTAGDFGLGGSRFPFDDKKGSDGSFIDVRDSEKVGFEDAFNSSFNSPMDLGFSFGTGEPQGWTLGMDPVPQFDDSKWNGSEFGPSGYVSKGNELLAVDNSFGLNMDEKLELGNNCTVSASGFEDFSDCFLNCKMSPISNFDDPDGIFSDCTLLDGGINKVDGTRHETDCHNDRQQRDKLTIDVAPAKSLYPSLGEKSSKKLKNLEDDKGEVKNMLIIKPGEVDVKKPDLLGGYSTCPDYTNQIQGSECQPSFAQPFTPVMHYENRPLLESHNLTIQRGSVENPHFFASGSSLPLNVAGDECQRFPTCNIDYQDPSKQPYMQNIGATPRKIQHLNPQEKIEKLKRRQQMLAMLAIEKQHRQFNGQMNDIPGPYFGSPWMDPLTPVPQEPLSQISSVEHGVSKIEPTVSQLGSVVAKLDDNIRICMRDSLFRLAKSASRRMCYEDSSSMYVNGGYTDKVARNAADSSHLRFLNQSLEPQSNQIDRVVALLLFNTNPENVTQLINEMPPQPVVPQTSLHKACVPASLYDHMMKKQS